MDFEKLSLVFVHAADGQGLIVKRTDKIRESSRECPDRLVIADRPDDIDPERLHDAFRVIRVVYDNDGIVPPSPQRVRPANNPAQRLKVAPADAPADAQGPIANIDPQHIHMAQCCCPCSA